MNSQSAYRPCIPTNQVHSQYTCILILQLSFSNPIAYSLHQTLSIMIKTTPILTIPTVNTNQLSTLSTSYTPTSPIASESQTQISDSFVAMNDVMTEDDQDQSVELCTGTCTIISTANNTHVSIRWSNQPSLVSLHVTAKAPQGSRQVSGSTGLCGFKGTKRGTPHAAEMRAQLMVSKAIRRGMDANRVNFHVILCGTGRGRAVVIKSLTLGGMRISAVSDGTPFAHNGCRHKKARRI